MPIDASTFLAPSWPCSAAFNAIDNHTTIGNRSVTEKLILLKSRSSVLAQQPCSFSCSMAGGSKDGTVLAVDAIVVDEYRKRTCCAGASRRTHRTWIGKATH